MDGLRRRKSDGEKLVATFYEVVRDQQIAWRRWALADQTPGFHKGKPYPHILPRRRWGMNLWPDIAAGVPAYLREKRVQAHTAKHNLCSSWILCANLYFPFRNPAGYDLLAAFLRERLSLDVSSVDGIDLEYEAEDENYKPAKLLGEDQGSRGAGQTSPDVAFTITTPPERRGLILVESKFTEHWFYECSGHRRRSKDRAANPSPNRCDGLVAVLRDPAKQCHLTSWGRKYWDYLHFDVAYAGHLSSCPAASGAYQLFRQQALAEALVDSHHWALVVSAVAFDERNADNLFRVIRSSDGVRDVRSVWPELLRLRAPFKTFSHQAWVAWVRAHGGGAWRDWLRYMQERYGY